MAKANERSTVNPQLKSWGYYMRCKNAGFILLFTFLLSLQTQAAGTFDFNTNCKVAYEQIFSLRLESGKQLIATEKALHPDNLIPVLLESYVDLLGIIASDNQALLAQLKSGKASRLDALKNGNHNSPWHRYVQAEVQLHAALMSFQYQEYWSGLMDMRKAYSLLEENIRLHPDFKPNLKSFFAIQALLGAVPEKYAWGLRLLGMDGDLQQGMKNLEWLTKEDWKEQDFLKDEAAHIYIQLLFHLVGDKKKAWEELQKAAYPLEENLFSYSTAIKLALYSNHNDTALALLARAPQGKEYAALPILKYYAGIAHMNQLKTEDAMNAFEQFIATTTGNNFLKSANHKIAWCYLMNGDVASYKTYMQKVSAAGNALAEADKQAQKETGDALTPQPEILKARVLFDGGYFEQSLSVLQSINPQNLSAKVYGLELVYRKARALHEMGDTLPAIESYMVAISRGKTQPYYYAANAALNLGLIYESKGNKALARQFFNLCLGLDNHEYKVSLGQKAKAGLERVK